MIKLFSYLELSVRPVRIDEDDYFYKKSLRKWFHTAICQCSEMEKKAIRSHIAKRYPDDARMNKPDIYTDEIEQIGYISETEITISFRKEKHRDKFIKWTKKKFDRPCAVISDDPKISKETKLLLRGTNHFVLKGTTGFAIGIEHISTDRLLEIQSSL